MNILIFSPGAYKKYGHSFDYCKGLAEACIDSGIQVGVFGYNGPLAFNPNIKEIRIGADGVYKRDNSLFGKIKWGIEKITGSNWFLKEFIAYVEGLEEKPYVIFETFEYLSLKGKLRDLNVEFSCIFHDTNFNFKQSNLLAGIYKFLCRLAVKQIVKKSTRSFVHGKSMKENFVNQIGNQFAKKVTVLPYGAPNPLRATEKDRVNSKQKLGLQPTKKYLLSFGTLRQDKKFDEVVELLSINDEWDWIIAGPEGDLDYGHILSLAEAYNVQDRLQIHNRFIENHEQKTYFEAADIVVNLYKDYIRHESGTAQLARTYNKPLIVSGPPDLINYVEDRGIGWISNKDTSINEILINYQKMPPEKKQKTLDNIYNLALENSWNNVLGIILKDVV